MRSSTGRWVGGDDFFDRVADLKILKRLVEGRNHILLTGQRRMGKTSVVRELGRQLEAEGWVFLFTDVEGATCPEDAVASIAEATYSVRPIMADAPERIAEAIEVLEHDGYLVADNHGHHFSSRLLQDWWIARFRDHHVPLDARNAGDESRECE